MRLIPILVGFSIVALSGLMFAGIRAESAGADPLVQQRPRVAVPDFPATLEWLNTDKPLSLRDLRGKVVLLDFWTYCCINCIHVIPDLKKLEAKYPNELVVIGVHSAKFVNEKDSDNIREAILRYEIEHPVINDKDLIVWNLYGINSWPSFVLIDPDGKGVGGVSGEGHYTILDNAITQVIKEFGPKINRKPMKFALEKENKPKSVLSYPGKITADPKTNRLFFTDSNHNRVIVASMGGAIQEVIGEGEIGLKDGDYETARFFRPQGLTFDPIRNVLYVADTENHAIRMIDLAAKKVTTLAGNGKQARVYPPRGGLGVDTELSSPWDVLIFGNNLYVAMAGSHQLWELDLRTLQVVPYAGSGRENIVDGELKDAALAQPSGLATDGKKLYFADSEVSAVRTADLTPAGSVHTLIGQGLFEFGDKDGPYPAARLQHPIGVAYHDGYVYVADTYNHKIKRVNPQTKELETFIGSGRRGMVDGPAKQASLSEPNGLVFVGDKIYIADTNNHLIRVFDLPTGMLSTLRFTGIDKLSKRTMAAFKPGEKKLPVQDVTSGTAALQVIIILPKGTKFNRAAPFRIQAKSDKPELVAVGEFNIAEASNKLIIPLSPKTGQATISVDLLINYCSVGNEGLCYFKETTLLIPVRVTPGGANLVTAAYTL